MTRYDPLVSVHHMLDHAREAVELTRDRSRADLDEDRLLNLALVRLVEVMGEAASRVPLDDDDLERLVLARSPRFQALLEYLLNNLGDAPRPPILGEHIPPKVGGLGGRDILLTPNY